MRDPEKLGLYGDAVAPKPFGVETTALEYYEDPTESGKCLVRSVLWLVESERSTWVITSRNARPPLAGKKFAEQTQFAGPWTSVNNCTGSTLNIPRTGDIQRALTSVG